MSERAGGDQAVQLPGLGDQHVPRRQRLPAAVLKIAGQLADKPGHPVLLDVRQGVNPAVFPHSPGWAYRLLGRQDDYLRFTQDFAVPPGNSRTERDIRLTKLGQKVPGACAPSPVAARPARSAATCPPSPTRPQLLRRPRPARPGPALDACHRLIYTTPISGT